MFARRNVEVSSYALDTEGAALGQQILSCLRLANINANDQRLSVSAMGGVNFGIVISGNDPALNGALRDSLEIHGRLFVAPFGTPLMHGAGIVAHMGPVVNPDATVFIGAKPIAQ
jgi:hypothetical protein